MAESIILDLQQSFGDLNEAVLVTNSNRTIIFVNKAAEQLLKANSSALVGTTTKRFFADPEQFEAMADLYEKPSDSRHRKAHAIDLLKGDGTKCPAEVVSAPLFTSSHELSGLLFIARDVTERIALETKLSDIALTLEDALDAISEGFALYDTEDRLVLCNDNYRDIYAHSAPAIFPGNRFEDILQYGLTKNQYDTGGKTNEEWIAERLKQHEASDGQVIEQQLDDGRWLRISETRTLSGGIAGIRADITELKKARAEAEKAFKNLSLIADNLYSSITEVDLDGRCVFINKTGSEWFAGTDEGLIGTRLRDKLPWKEREQVRTMFQRAIKGENVSEEVRFHFPDGVTRECEFQCNPRIDDNGEVHGLVVLINDITDRKKTERTLAELYAITSTQELSHEDKISEILRLGSEHFELPFAIISHVIDQRYTITHAHSPGGELVPGTSFDLKDTYCTLTLQAEGPLATASAAHSEFAKHPCYELFALETYIGAPLLVDGLVHGTINFSAPDSRKRPFSPADVQIVRQFADWIGHEIARQRDHEALMNAKINLERVASIDDLTQVLNRRAFLERANTEIQRFRRTKRPLTAVMIDIDKFKAINDNNGHAAGDAVLKRFADIINGALRAVDVFGRVGGEEFCLILHNTEIEDALMVSERLRQKIIEQCQFEEIDQLITCSMGLAPAAREEIEFSTLMQKADMALYEAKTTGRNKCIVYKDEMAPAGL
ncbi:diguanylate cyclase [Roseibium denhamense]|uniref:PAS domain S-box-containing protein/diguanylate cyclase (GGDEF) domain-containing protein n=1 Tax=Roseibium denhamense TaxID=76305 RepID=A0ABY1NM65_9HYPH|nr:diguanylate cyclase [Roseibium denhamense]MTI06875.1 diguanylate cyclase [Roseibium denhamense]SMP12287.1 PAS domain S-box-containing protein/diguanylate cyclase (GGDEF) domain-containing protein [Roseibium denhamense]